MKPYYDHDGITIYHGDCREILPHLPKVDLVLTDPPYLVRAGAGGGAFGNGDHLVNTGGFTDGGVDYGFLGRYENWFCFCSRRQLPALLGVAQERERWNLITWCKPNPVPTCNNKYLPDVEYIVHGFSGGRIFGSMSVKSCFALHPCGNKETPHPNEKPFAVVAKLVHLGTKAGETILDPYVGSGTTLVAAKRLGRKCIGIEIEEKYCEIAARRVEAERLTLFEYVQETQGDLFHRMTDTELAVLGEQDACKELAIETARKPLLPFAD